MILKFNKNDGFSVKESRLEIVFFGGEGVMASLQKIWETALWESRKIC